MHQRVVWSALALLFACSKPDKSEPKKETPEHAEADKGSAIIDAATQAQPFDLAERLTTIGNNFAEAFEMAVKQGHDAVKPHCTELPPLLQPSCYSGIAAAHLAKKGSTAKDFEAVMATINPATGAGECQALGFSAEDSPKLAGIAKDLASDDCRANFWEGHGNQRAIAAAGAATAVCRKAEGKPDAEACAKQRQAFASSDLVGTLCATGKTKAKTKIPAGMDTACAHGVGQGLVFLFTDAGQAVEACGGKTQQLVDACISGAGYVTTMSAPDRVDATVEMITKLQPAQQAAFARGMGRALSYRKRQDEKSYTAWLAELPAPQRQQAERLTATHDKCTSYFELDKCEWSK